jgi:Fe2+ transport system protein B
MDLHLYSRMRLYVVHTDDIAVYLTTGPVHVDMSRVTTRFHMEAMFGITVFARVICALFFFILAAEKSGYVKYADFFVEVLIWVLF